MNATTGGAGFASSQQQDRYMNEGHTAFCPDSIFYRVIIEVLIRESECKKVSNPRSVSSRRC
jgi:hypothetical protein